MSVQLYNAKQLAERLARTPREVERLRKDDPTFPRPFRLRPGGEPVFDEADVARWIAERKAASAAEDGELPGMVETARRLLREAS